MAQGCPPSMKVQPRLPEAGLAGTLRVLEVDLGDSRKRPLGVCLSLRVPKGGALTKGTTRTSMIGRTCLR